MNLYHKPEETMNKAFNGDTFLQQQVKELAARLGITVAIETGTHKGDTTVWLAENFDWVYTVEIDRQYKDILAEALKPYQNVSMQYGDTKIFLQSFLNCCGENGMVAPPLVFLDAHWFENPLKTELKIIAESGKKPLLVIHDFYNPNHPDYQHDTYPALDYRFENIKTEVEEIYGKDGYVVEYNGQTNLERGIGCIFIYEKKNSNPVQVG